MGRHSNEWNKGYQAAIEAIKQIQNNSSSGGGGQDNGLDSLPQTTGGDNNQSGNGQNSQQSRDSQSGGNQGVVRPEDCIGPDSINGVPSIAGGMLSREEGDSIAESEGYELDGGSDATMEREWRDVALKSCSKMKGDKAGSYISKIEALYNSSKDWKKELKKIVGMSISPEDKRQAYANKNVLISQDRIARTDKDKYDNLDYMMAWIDSSGSMSDEQLKMCLSEVYAVALAKKPLKLVVIQCDTKIQDIKEYTDLRALKRDMIHASVKGRGGTELKPCWDLLLNDPKYKRRQCELVMVFTDGYLNQYKRNPKTMRNICWVILNNPGFKIQYKDINTKCVYINTDDIK